MNGASKHHADPITLAVNYLATTGKPVEFVSLGQCCFCGGIAEGILAGLDLLTCRGCAAAIQGRLEERATRITAARETA